MSILFILSIPKASGIFYIRDLHLPMKGIRKRDCIISKRQNNTTS